MSTDNTESQLDRQLLYEGKIIKVFKDTVLLSDNKRTTREIVEHVSVVCVMALDEDGYIHMVKQYRYAISGELMEIPAGGIEQGESPEEAAVRELQEEIGKSPGQLIQLGGFWLTPGWSDEYMYAYLATDLTDSKLPADDDENIQVIKVPLGEILREINSGLINDAKTIATVLLGNNYLNRV
tara:strand:- start:2745 stop:3290 length:546 start_codon:yes stop_codon:yes gene_type:complete